MTRLFLVSPLKNVQSSQPNKNGMLDKSDNFVFLFLTNRALKASGKLFEGERKINQRTLTHTICSCFGHKKKTNLDVPK